MTTDEDWAFLVDALDPLREPLHEALVEADEVARGHFAEYDMEPCDYRAGSAHLARCHARRLLVDKASDGWGGWTLAKPGANARLWLANQGLRIRVLRPLGEAVTPPPGSNRTRIAYYSNAHRSLLGIGGSNLLALWTVGDSGESSIRIVRPIGKWRYGSNEKVDVDFYLPQAPTSLGDLEFRPTDDLGLRLPFEDEDEKGQRGSDESGG